MTIHAPHTSRGFLQVTAATLILDSLPSFAAEASKLRIGIIGSGRVGSALGTTWAKAGHTVMFSSLDIEQDKKLAAGIGVNARAGTPLAGERLPEDIRKIAATLN